MMQMDLFAGKAKKKAGMDSVSNHNTSLLELLRHTAWEISNRTGSVSTDELRVWASERGLKPTHRNFWGCVLSKNAGFVVVGRKQSEIPSSHSREIRVWRYQS